eukprot:3204736-Karenia_brevis.AAC.1
MNNEEIREDHVQMPARLAGMDLVNTDQADMGRSGGHVVDTDRRNRLCDGGDLVSKYSLQEDLSTTENVTSASWKIEHKTLQSFAVADESALSTAKISSICFVR